MGPSELFSGAVRFLALWVVMTGASSVVVDDLDVEGVVVLPDEADAPLIVDANAVLTCSVPFQVLQMVTGRYAKVLDRPRIVDEQKLDACPPLEIKSETTYGLPVEDAFGVAISEASYHTAILSRCDTAVKPRDAHRPRRAL